MKTDEFGTDRWVSQINQFFLVQHDAKVQETNLKKVKGIDKRNI